MKRHLLAALSLAFAFSAPTVVSARNYTVAAVSPSVAPVTGGSQSSFETICRKEDTLSSLFSDVGAGCACMDKVMHQVFTPEELGFVVSQIQTDMFDLENPSHHDNEAAHAAFVAKLERSDEKLNADCQAYLDVAEAE